MMVIFSPWRMLGGTCLWAFGGSVVLWASIYQSPVPHPLWIGVLVGGCVDLIAVWTALTAVRYIWASWWAIMRGPE